MADLTDIILENFGFGHLMHWEYISDDGNTI